MNQLNVNKIGPDFVKISEEKWASYYSGVDKNTGKKITVRSSKFDSLVSGGKVDIKFILSLEPDDLKQISIDFLSHAQWIYSTWSAVDVHDSFNFILANSPSEALPYYGKSAVICLNKENSLNFLNDIKDKLPPEDIVSSINLESAFRDWGGKYDLLEGI